MIKIEFCYNKYKNNNINIIINESLECKNVC